MMDIKELSIKVSDIIEITGPEGKQDTEGLLKLIVKKHNALVAHLKNKETQEQTNE